MFSLDRWLEILDTLWRSKLRTALTAMSMAWGIFMLVMLLGLGNGLQNGAEKGFADDATNSIWLRANRTSRPAHGLPVGRRIHFENRDVTAISELDHVEHITGRFHIRGGMWGGELTVRAGAKAQPFDVRAVHPGHLYLEKTLIEAGRFLNDRDVAARRKVAVLGIPVATFLWGHTDVIGQWVEINRVPFQVVGIFDDEGGESEQNKVYVPITTAQLAFNGAERVNAIMFTVGDASLAEAKALEGEVKELLAERHGFAADDPQAVWANNNVENFENFRKIFLMINVFVSLMAGCAIVAGVVGVSNIMMIVVRERTREIGIRKALGATPFDIVSSIVQEAVFLTACAGYLGLVGGVAALRGLAAVMPANEMFADPSIDLTVAVAATAVLVLAGALAGLFPALKAAKVDPIVALRDE
jgi:putative ABC transport system permease protein